MVTNGITDEVKLKKQAYWRGFLPLVHVLRSHFLIHGQSEKEGATITPDVLKWLVVSEDIEEQKARRWLSCSDTRADGKRKKRYTSLRKVWVKNQSSFFPHGELSKWVFNHAPNDLVIVLRTETDLDRYRQWINDLKDTNVWKFEPNKDSVIVLEKVFPSIDFNDERTKNPDKLLNFLSDLDFATIEEIKNTTKTPMSSLFHPLWDKKELACYFAWLVCHDTDAEAWIYVRPPNINLHGLSERHSQTGVVICLGFLPKPEDLALRYLDTLGWGVANAFETTSLLLADQGGDHRYILGALSEMQAKGALLNQIWRRNADLSYRLPRRQHSNEQTNRRHRHTYIPLACLFPYLSSTKNLGLRWASFFEWDPIDDTLDRIGWAIGSGWPRVKERLENEPAYWEQTRDAIYQFSHAADVMHLLHREEKIELIGDILFAQSSRKSPVIITCRQTGGLKGDDTITTAPTEEHYALDSDAHNYVFVTLDAFMKDLIPILNEGAIRVRKVEQDDYASFLDELYEKFEQALNRRRITQLTETLRMHFERKLHPSLSHAEKFGEMLIRHLIWVFLHEPHPESAFSCLAYFPSRIKPDVPSGGCLLAFDDVPSATDLILIDNYVSDYFVAKSLISSEFETDLPCALTNKGFERSLITSSKRAFHSIEKDAILTLSFLDMDGLKSINDTTKEHILGTNVIRVFSEVLAECLDDPSAPIKQLDEKSYDVLLGRWGGDEFLIGIVKPIDKTSGGTEIQNETEWIETLLVQQLTWTQNLLKEKCRFPNECFSPSLEHFRRQKRIDPYFGENDGDPALRKIKDAMKVTPLSFTVAIGSSTFRHAAKDEDDKHPVKIYEDLRSKVDKACFIAKRMRRGSCIRLIDTAEDANGNIICLAPNRYEAEKDRLYDTPPTWGIQVTVDVNNDSDISKLITCVCDSFNNHYGKDVNILARTEPEPEILIGIFDPDGSVATPDESLINVFVEQWKRSMRWKRIPLRSKNWHAKVHISAVEDYRAAVESPYTHWQSFLDLLFDLEFHFTP